MLALLIWFGTAALVLVFAARDYLERENVDASRRVELGIKAIEAAAIALGVYLAVKTYGLSQRGQVTDRFGRAIDQIGAVSGATPNVEVRIGGIYALGALANDEENYRQQVLEVLTAYVRQNAPWKRGERPPTPPKPLPQPETALAQRPRGCSGAAPPPEDERPRGDIQAAVAVIALRAWDLPPGFVIDLSHTDLHGGRFDRARLEGANLTLSRLDGTSFNDANLRNADLRGSSLINARLQRADLRQDGKTFPPSGDPRPHQPWFDNPGLLMADLQGADLDSARLEDSWIECCLIGANLRDAHLERSRVGATVRGAYWFCTHLRGADLSSVAQEQTPAENEDLRNLLAHADFEPGTLPKEIDPTRDPKVRMQYLETRAHDCFRFRREFPP